MDNQMVTHHFWVTLLFLVPDVSAFAVLESRAVSPISPRGSFQWDFSSFFSFRTHLVRSAVWTLNQLIRLCLLEQFPFQSVYTLLAGDLTPKHLPSPGLEQSKPQLAIDSHSVNSVIWRDCPSNSPGPLPGVRSSQEYQLWSNTSLLVSESR